MKYKDYYKILGIDKTASQEDIKKAYRKLAKQHHPDKNKGDTGAEDKFKEVGEAYEALGDVDKRSKYDNFESEANFGNGYDFDPKQYGYNENVQYEYQDAGDHSDFFNMFFSSGFNMEDLFGSSRSNSRAHLVYDGEHVEAEIEITPEEGANGLEKRISLQTSKGTKNFTFKIPKGVNDGEKIRLKGQGYPGTQGGKNGDLRLIVRFVKSTRFALEGNNLLTSVDVYPWDAALGGKVFVPTLNERIKVNIPEGIQTDSRIRVAGKGYPARNAKQGDLYIKVRIVNPKPLLKKQRELYEQLKKAS